ncbi:MAG: hypothetical protein MPJ78_01355 [Hyphomicrobiaceae bacterium]|nr:hypothetical protein [Hyphomicrobiaceae bacterium]
MGGNEEIAIALLKEVARMAARGGNSSNRAENYQNNILILNIFSHLALCSPCGATVGCTVFVLQSIRLKETNVGPNTFSGCSAGNQRVISKCEGKSWRLPKQPGRTKNPNLAEVFCQNCG